MFPILHFEICLDSNPESCRSKQVRYHPSPTISSSFVRTLRTDLSFISRHKYTTWYEYCTLYSTRFKLLKHWLGQCMYNKIRYLLLLAMVGTTSLAVSFGLAPFLVAFCRSAHKKIHTEKKIWRERLKQMNDRDPKRTCGSFWKKNYVKMDKWNKYLAGKKKQRTQCKKKQLKIVVSDLQ